MTIQKKNNCCACLALAAVGWVGALAAATYTWTGEGGATGGVYNWNDPANWGGLSSPGAGDIAVLGTDDNGALAIPAGGVTVSRIYAPGGSWRFTGGTLTLTDAAPFSSDTGTYNQRAALMTFDCPVNFSATSDKTILGGNTFNDTVALGKSGRAFFMKGDVAGASGLTVFSGNRTYDYTGNSNICAGKNDGNAAHGGEMYITGGATVKAKKFFDFAGSTTTVENGTLVTTEGGTDQSLDMTHGAVLNVLAGGTVACAGRLAVGQSGDVGAAAQLNIRGGTVTANYLSYITKDTGRPSVTVDDGGRLEVVGNLDFRQGAPQTAFNIGKGTVTVGGTWTQGGSQQLHFYVPADQQLGSLTAGTVAHTSADNTVTIFIHDETPANGTTYTLVTDLSKTTTLADYTVTYNGLPAVEKGALRLTDGVLTFQPAATTVVWTGAGDGVHFSDGANWSGGTAPTAESSIRFGLAAGGTLENDLDDATVDAVWFEANAGAFTIGGKPLVIASSLVSRSAVEQTFTCAVSAPEGQAFNADYSAAGVVFAGGLTCLDIVSASNLGRVLKGGVFTFTRTQPEGDDDNDLWATTSYTVAAGATLNIPGELFVRDGQGNPKFLIEEGATMNVGMYRCRASFETFDVKGTLNVGVLWGWGFTPVFTTTTSTGTLNVGGVRVSANNPHRLRVARTNIGAEGITGYVARLAATDVKYPVLSDGVTLGATADWTLSVGEVLIPAFKLDVPGAATLDTDGHVVTLRAPLTGEGTLTLTDDTILDISDGSVGVKLSPQPGATIRTLPALTKTLPIALPVAGPVNIELLSTDGLPAGSQFTLFAETGLSAVDAGAFKVTVPGHDDVKGTVSIVGEALVFTVTESDTAAGVLTWRPTTDEEAAGWSTALTSWQDEAGLATVYRSFSDVTFDGTEAAYTDGVVTLAADVSVGALTVDGARDYTFAGTGRLLGKAAVTKSGAGTLTLDAALSDQPHVAITGGTLKLGANLPLNGLGTAGTNGTVAIAAGGQLDLNYTVAADNDATRASLVSDRLITAAGDGPDGQGAIVNNGGSPNWYASLGRLVLAGDTVIGGVSRIDFRSGSTHHMAYEGRPFVDGGDYTLTSKLVPVGGKYGLFFRNADVTAGKLAVAPGAVMGSEGDSVFQAPRGIEMGDGAIFDAWGGSISAGDAGTVLAPAEGAAALLRNNNATLAVNLDLATPADSTLTVRDNTIQVNGAIDNAGTVAFAGGTQNLSGPLRGTGAWQTTGGTTWLATPAVPETLDWTLANGAAVQIDPKFQAPGTDVSVTGNGCVRWGNYETNAVPAVKSLTLLDNIGFSTFAAMSQTLPPVVLVNTNNLCGHYTDNLQTHVKFVEGSLTTKDFWVGGGIRGGHFSAYTGTAIDANLFHVGHQSYTAPRAIFSLEGGSVAIGSNGLRSQYAPLGTFMFFNAGTLAATADFTTSWGLCGVFGRDASDGAPLKIDVADHTITYRGGLGGKATVGVVGTGSFNATDPNGNGDYFQDFAEGRWIVRAATNDLSGASAFAGGLEVGAGATARVAIAGEELCEFTHYGTTAWEQLFDARNAVWQIANNMNHLHLRQADGVKPYSNHSFVYRGQFYVAEAANWTFAGTYDDRLALAVDGVEVLKTTGAGDVKCGTIALAEGWHDYFIVAEDASGTQGPTAWAGMGLGWTDKAVSSLDQADYRKFAIGEPGLKFRLANAVQWERKSMARLEDMSGIPQIDDFETITVTNTLQQLSSTTWPEAQMALNRFTGSFYVTAELAGSWRFRCGFDDYLWLSVDGVSAEITGRDNAKESPVSFELAEGWHAFEIRCYDRGGGWGPWPADNIPYAVGVTITPGGQAPLERMAFDERNFRFTRLSKPARAGLAGTVTVHDDARLENAADGACPIWDVLAGAGTLAGKFRFMPGSKWRLAGGGRTLAGVTFAADAAEDALADLSGIEVELAAKPLLPKYDIAPALGLTAETAAEIPVTTVGADADKARFSATVEDGRLVLVNANPGGLTIVVR